MNKTFVPLFAALLLSASAAFSQSDTARLSGIATKLNKYTATHPLEKAYLHLNKDRYTPGDTIWMKGYVTVGAQHQPSALSGVLYIDLIDSKGQSVKSLKLKSNNGLSTGSIALNENLAPGVYRLRAYTNWMRNFGDGTFYEHAISVTIGNIGGVLAADKKTAATASGSENTQMGADIQFFPEGGKLINGVRSKVAFKAIGTNGLGLEVNGTIVDNDNQTVAEFSSQHLGMGVFAMLPQSGKTYTAKVNNLSIPLPKVEDRGFVLSVNSNPQDSTKLNIRVATNDATLAEKTGQSFYIVGQSNGQIYFTTAGKLTGATFLASVSKANFPTGIAQFTLFLNNDMPVNERVVFISNPADMLHLNLSNTKAVYKAKEGVILNLTAKDDKQHPVQGNFSVAVYHDAGNDSGEGNILTHLLLTSDLKGYVEQPAYYFTPGHQTELDNLLLTQGYRSFVWGDILQPTSQAVTFQPEKGLNLTGTLTKSHKPVVNGKIKVLSTAEAFSSETTTDANGRFVISNMPLEDTTRLLVEGSTAKGEKSVDIVLEPHTAPTITADNSFMKPEAAQIAKTTVVADTAQITKARKANAAHKSINGNRELDEVIITQRKNLGTSLAPWIVVNPHSANLNGAGHADQVINTKDMQNCVDFLDCIINRIAGVTMRNGNYYFFHNIGKSLTNPPPVKFMVDGVFGVNIDNVSALSVNDVATVEVLKSSSYLNLYGTDASGGLIIITTKVGTEDPGYDYYTRAVAGLVNMRYTGFDPQRSYYVPKYTANSPIRPDDRTSVYWNANVLTDANGNFSTQFFNSDVKGNFSMVIEGIDDNGSLGRAVYHYKVQ